MTAHLIAASRHAPELSRFPMQSVGSRFLSTIGLVASAFSEMQEVRREAEKLHRFAED
jgi:hypothetical protein